jgi:predicted DCC family thiol-disulfide oxidoreductase YuxK
MQSNIVLLFDGECNLCNQTVQFIIKRDKKAKIKFASLHCEYAKKIFKKKNINESYNESIVLIVDQKIYFKSDAALNICRYLSGFWPVLYGFKIFPKFMRDSVYNYIAKNRLKWFGKTDSCQIMLPEISNRFIA